MNILECSRLLKERDGQFWSALAAVSRASDSLGDTLLLSGLRRKALRMFPEQEIPAMPLVKVALIGGYTLFPLHECVEHELFIRGYRVQFTLGDYDNYVSEMMNPASSIHGASPEVVVVLPAGSRCVYDGNLTDERGRVEEEARRSAGDLLQLCAQFREVTPAEIILGNFRSVARFDIGSYRARAAGYEWNYRRTVNSELAFHAPAAVTICDLDFLACRMGCLAASDDRAWFESRQPGSDAFVFLLAREIAHLTESLRRPGKKVLVLDLDNTLWGGVIGDDGVNGIDLGDASPRGEAFKAFQKYVKSLVSRGFLLAVCSKNNREVAEAPFREHPDMVLQLDDFASFKANWRPKSDNLIEMASELNLGLDSFVFVDDNPAEVEIVRQFAPEVATICLGTDPSSFVGQLQDSRYFELRTLTNEDAARTKQYQEEAKRKEHRSRFSNMAEYLDSLEMVAVMSSFTAVDAARISQLINRSNQFNLTTRRRTQAEVDELVADANHITLSVRLADRFGDHGLIGTVIGRKMPDQVVDIDTWLMSCRVLERQVEESTLNELARRAIACGVRSLRGVYLPTKKNKLVEKLFDRLGFTLLAQDDDGTKRYELDLVNFSCRVTHMKIERVE